MSEFNNNFFYMHGGGAAAATTALIAGAGGALGAAVVSQNVDSKTEDVKTVGAVDSAFGDVQEVDFADNAVEPALGAEMLPRSPGLGEVQEKDPAFDVIEPTLEENSLYFIYPIVSKEDNTIELSALPKKITHSIDIVRNFFSPINKEDYKKYTVLLLKKEGDTYEIPSDLKSSIVFINTPNRIINKEQLGDIETKLLESVEIETPATQLNKLRSIICRNIGAWKKNILPTDSNELLKNCPNETVNVFETALDEVPEKAVTVDVVPALDEVPEEAVVDVEPALEEVPEEAAVDVVPELDEVQEKDVAVDVEPALDEVPEKAAVDVVPELDEVPEKAAVDVVPELDEVQEKDVAVDVEPALDEVPEEAAVVDVVEPVK